MRWVVLLAVLLVTPAMAQDDRGPIRIVADEDFLPTNGVRGGQGTAADPYIIEDWRIRPSVLSISGTPTAVHIENTQAHVLLRDLVIEAPFDTGIRFLEASNITVQSVRLQGQGTAVSLQDVQDIRLLDLDILEAGPAKFASGVLLTQGTRVLMQNVVVLDGDSLGVQVTTSRFVRLDGVRVSGHDGGFGVFSAKDVDLVGVQADGNQGDGIRIHNVTRLQALGLRAMDQMGAGQSGRGVLVWESQGAIRDLEATGNQDAGIFIADAAIDVFGARLLDNGGDGGIFEAADMRLAAVEAHGNGGAGLRVLPPAGQPGFLRADAVQVHDNGGAGLVVQGMLGIHLEGVRADLNGGAGIDIRGSANLTLLSSHLLGNEDSGLLLVQVQDGQLVGNTATGNEAHGFALRDVARLRVRDNQANLNGGSGFVLDGPGLEVTGNQADGNGAFGVEVLPAAQDTTLEGNRLAGNGFGNVQDHDGRPKTGIPAPLALAALAVALRVRHQFA